MPSLRKKMRHNWLLDCGEDLWHSGLGAKVRKFDLRRRFLRRDFWFCRMVRGTAGRLRVDAQELISWSGRDSGLSESKSGER